MHLDDCKDVVEDVGVLGFDFGQGVWVEHNDESSDGQARVDGSEKDEAYELLHFWAVFFELNEGGDGNGDD